MQELRIERDLRVAFEEIADQDRITAAVSMETFDFPKESPLTALLSSPYSALVGRSGKKWSRVEF